MDIESQLIAMWDKIQQLRQSDTFAAQVLYEKYKALELELPPQVPSVVVENQTVS